jgi:hypothetical protein
VIVDLAPNPINSRIDTPIPPERPEENPALTSVLGAAFRQDNSIVSAIANETNGVSQAPDGIEVWKEIKGTQYEPSFEAFAGVRNRKMLDATMRQIDMEEEDRKTLAAAPWYKSVPSILAANVTDPTMLIPGAAIVRNARGGISVVKTALSGAALTGAGATVQETLLQDSQIARPMSDSVVNIGASVFLGGMFGAAASKLLSRGEWNEMVARVDLALAKNEPSTPVPHTPFSNSIGAAALEPRSLNELSVAGVAAGSVTAATGFLNPSLRIMESPNPITRQVGAELFEMTRYLRGNDDGFATPQAVETLRKEWNAGLMKAVQSQDQEFISYLKSGNAGIDARVATNFAPYGGFMSREEFRKEVGKAMRRNDEHENPFVAASARSWRKNVFDPLKESAIAAKLLPADVAPSTAASYLSRMWNRRRLIAEEGEFKRVVSDWVQSSIPKWANDFDLETIRNSVGLDAKKQREYTAARAAEREDRFGGNGQQLANDIGNEVFDVLTGKVQRGVRSDFVTINSRGPLKERTFAIPDELVERWLESDVDLVGRRYTRVMGADVELAKKFGRPDMQDQLDKIREGYRALRSGETNEATLQKWDKMEAADIRDLTGVRDILRGTVQESQLSMDWGHIARIANLWNYIRSLGNVVLSSLGDALRIPMVHGLRPFMDGAFAAFGNRSGFKLATEEARLAGNVAERVLAHRMATLAEISDVYTSRGPVEKFLENMANVASNWNGIRLWTDSMKQIASTVTQNRILQATGNFLKASKEDRRYLAFLGIDESMAGRIAEQFSRHGETIGNVRAANTTEWTDPVAVRAYRAALNKDVDSIIVTKGAADTPLFANTPLGRTLLQFSTFSLAAHQRVLLRGLQESQTRFISSVIAMTTLGMLQTYLAAVANNTVNKLPEFEKNPGWWISEGLDKSGIISVFFLAANATEKLSGYNVAKAPFTVFDDGSTGSTKLLNRNMMSVLGPSAGLLEDLQALVQAPKTYAETGELKQAQKNSLERLLPYNSYAGVRQMLRYLINPRD